MSELRIVKFSEMTLIKLGLRNDKLYFKDEADKVIAHQKYKRCLAMAKRFEDKIDAIKNGYIRSSIKSQNGVMTTCPPECNPKFSFFSKWHKRWLELAERFKED